MRIEISTKELKHQFFLNHPGLLMPNSVKLQDVANLAGVSIGTASQALNNRPSVASATRSRVLDATKSLGYPIKPVADFKPFADVGVIGLLTKHDYGLPPDVSPFYSHIQAITFPA